MAKKCWRIDYLNCADVAGVGYECEESVQVVASGNSCGLYALRATSGKFNDGNSTCKTLTATLVSCDLCPDCCPLSGRCDCLNGECVPKATYGTPGIYLNFSDCQAGCAKNSNCTGECVDPAEIAALAQALHTLQTKFCH